jgi:ParB-like chromosome segregation protein Spo0J
MERMVNKTTHNQIKKVSIKEVFPNGSNPRLIRDAKFKSLCRSLKEFPEMLDIRPIVVNKDMVVIGGNQRYKAAVEIDLKEIPIIQVDLTQEQEREFAIKDNASSGEWDWEALANEWEVEELAHWGVDIPIEVVEEEKEQSIKHTKNITLTYSIEEADRIEEELYRIASTLEQAIQILLQK